MPLTPDDIDAFFEEHSLDRDLQSIIDELARSYEIGALQQGLTRSQAQQYSIDFAKRHAAELIQGLEDVSRERIKELVGETLSNGWSIDQLTGAIKDTGLFGRDRAKTIARTETMIAHGQGGKKAAEERGQDQKAWIRNQEEPDDECQDNEDEGWIDIDDVFPSGDDTIPAHPNCECTVIYRTSSLYEDDNGDDSGDETDDGDVSDRLTMYSPDQERDNHGRFGEGSPGGGKNVKITGATKKQEETIRASLDPLPPGVTRDISINVNPRMNFVGGLYSGRGQIQIHPDLLSARFKSQAPFLIQHEVGHYYQQLVARTDRPAFVKEAMMAKIHYGPMYNGMGTGAGAREEKEFAETFAEAFAMRAGGHDSFGKVSEAAFKKAGLT